MFTVSRGFFEGAGGVGSSEREYVRGIYSFVLCMHQSIFFCNEQQAFHPRAFKDVEEKKEQKEEEPQSRSQTVQ